MKSLKLGDIKLDRTKKKSLSRSKSKSNLSDDLP